MDPKLQTWDHGTQRYTRVPVSKNGITYQQKDLNQLAREVRPKDDPPLPETLRQRGRWSDQTGYTPDALMPPITIDPDNPLPGKELAEIVKKTNLR